MIRMPAAPGGNEERLRRRQRGPEQAGAHRFERRRERIERINPAQARGNRIHGIGHRAGVEQDLRKNRDDVRNVAIRYGERRGAQAEPQRYGGEHGHPHRQQKQRGRGDHVINHQQHGHHHRGNQEIHKIRGNR